MDVPKFLASSADIGSPVKIISMARDFPTARGRRCVPPAPKVKKKKRKKKEGHQQPHVLVMLGVSSATIKIQTLSKGNHSSH